ncbi:hypothetical protein [Neogemmobacter tilapiae]|uniref:Uncharacterized protein n=1 Tax=Neogemmobacter tilapiae TaxID=875041 RepID=A0A918TW93_9RHOB|nr:hypothetical protein [Gemmobacter tilapiae]GHC59650.1 hypothetical protein GCM10007315_24270 [Gemmobacter tilapiae]
MMRVWALGLVVLGWAGGAWAEDISPQTEFESSHPRYQYLSGVVEMVSKDGGFWIRNHKGNLIKLKEWALDADPELLNIVLLGREVNCIGIYRTEDYVGVACTVSITRTNMPPDSCTLSDYVNCRGAFGSLGFILKDLFSVQKKCTEFDRSLIGKTFELPPTEPYEEICDYYDEVYTP